MDRIHPHFIVKAAFCFLLLLLLQTSTDAQALCSGPPTVEFQENNTVNAVVTTINVLNPEVILEFISPPLNNPFELRGNQLIATAVLDAEESKTHEVQIECSGNGGSLTNLLIIVIVTDVNDNPPVFQEEQYQINVNEMTPVGTSVGSFSATDVDTQRLFYTLTDSGGLFNLTSPDVPNLLVAKPLEYDDVKNVQLILHVQDTPLGIANDKSYTASTTIMVTIVDVDNRPPWFQPCTYHEVGGALICQSSGYTGSVFLNEQETEALPLTPGPLYAIDGDSGIEETIMYSILSGNDDKLFEINPNTGNISMQRPADVLGTITLTVMAAQEVATYQFATTTITVSVQAKSLHRPQFQRPVYNAIITGVGNIAMNQNNKDQPLRIFATDEDYAATGGLNPHITYSINENSDFSIIDGYLFMTKDLPDGALNLEVVALDTSNKESATAQLSVEVASGLTTTKVPTDNTASTPTGESTSQTTGGPTFSTSTTIPSTTTTPTEGLTTTPTTDVPTSTTENIGESTTKPKGTEDPITATTATIEVSVPSGRYGLVEMAAVGVTLGVLLFICLVVIVVLIVRIKRGKADWRKIYETSMFRSSLGQGSGGQKEGIQYTNDVFQNDEDEDKPGTSGLEGGSVMAGEESQKDFPTYETIAKSLEPLHDLLRDDDSQAGSDNADSEKEVKPILTKERRMDEGYKSVWFKEDIDPDAKEEVVIIPDSRDEEDGSEEEDEHSSSGKEEDEGDNSHVKTPRVVFNDVDKDSGLSVKIEDPAEDSDDEEVMTVNL